ncbi:beta strand repeat-containing protein [Methanobrevibacter smithii]|uniref:beta strand repeat-containing protein n=1 Tax=Methanobrevibacter smithii TaxID=2173 RepID=UPI0037DCB883
MSIKKNIGVLVLLLVLLSMSAVSAEDVSINADDTYQTPNEIQKDFTSLQTDIDNSQGVFELTYDVKHGDDEIDNYGISITKTTIINGNGHTIDANGHGSIFVVKDSSVTLTLNDLTLINANPVSDSSGIVSNGGAVYFDGSTLIVNNVNFKNNAVYKYGGAIYTTGTCIVDSSVFDGNDVQFRSQNIDNGGAAIYADNGASLLISNSQIINNHKNMVIRDNNVGDLVDGVVVATGYTKISKSYFRNNSGCYGGAVTSLGYTNAGKNQIIIENSVFDSNRAFQGAAVNVIGSTFKISGTNFTNNKGVGYGSGNPNVGALLTWYNCEGTISDCNFINNTADNGAAYRLGDDNKGVSSASVDSCTFINNTASNQGGAVYEGGKTGKATLDIKNSIFINNSAKKEGSAIYSGYTLNIDDDTTFTNNMVYMYYTGTLNISEIKTFTDLQKAINMVEGDIHLSSNVTMLASEADNFVNGIVVDHLVNLKCDGFTINANNLGRIFNVTSTADKLNIYNANLINGNADIGGAIYNTGSVYAYNTNFINNTAATMGGAVFNNGTLTIQKCIVDNNDITKRTSSDSEDYGGAAIYNWYDSTLFIKNSTISNNLKNYKNGDYVVGAVTSLGKTIISQNSYFVNNSGRWGGAITTSGSSLPGKKVNELSISDSTFSKNGGLYGAGIFIQGSKFSITSCVFDSNTASGKGNMTPNDNNGAAIEVTNTDKAITGTISKSTFTNNKAQYGGAIDICAGTIKITNSKFINNSADVEGGAIDINALNGNPKVTISGSKFINNSAPLGGAILNIKDLTVKGSTFINNTPNTIFNWVGAGGNLNLNIKTFTDLQNAIGLVTGTLTLNQNVAMTAKEAADFTNGITINKDITIDGKGHTIDAKNLGRIFSIGEGFTVTLTNATLINGKATEGGAIYNDGSLTLSDVKLSDNAADSYGGAVFNNGELVVSDSVFDANDIVNRGSASVDYGGAAIYNWYDGTLTVSGSNFTNNIKNYKNGDYLVGAVATIGDATISDSYFVNNAGRWGGAITTSGALIAGDDVNTLTVSGSTFKENGGLYGAGIFVWASDFTVSDCVFDKNTASGKGNMTPNNNNGAAIEVTDTNKAIAGIITGSNFTNNKAQYGGAIDICEGNIKITDSEFVNNSADVEGGAIDINTVKGNPEVSISGSKFINNSASYGGAIVNVKDLTVRNTEFVNNTPNAIFNYVGFGGNLDLGIENFTDLQNAIGLVTGTLTLNQNVVMTDDEAANFVNGVIINKNIRIDGKGHTIDAKNLGRIFEIDGGFAVTLTNATLINGKADNGGAIYNFGNLDLVHVNFVNNTAKYGGAIMNYAYGLVLDDSTFTNNTAKIGGAIYNSADCFVVGNSTFVNNTATSNGGVIFNYGIGFVVGNSTFVNNSAADGAGAILNGGRGFVVANSTFVNNTATSKGGAIYNYGIGFVVGNSTFANNTAEDAGAVYNEGDNSVVGNSTFVNNTATSIGGAIINNGKLVVDNSAFEDNAANYYGGAIFNRDDLQVTNSAFDGNDILVRNIRAMDNVDHGGAAIYNWKNGKLDISKSNFTNNIKNYKNGNLLVGAVTTIGDATISDSYFVNNSGRWGGALSVMGGESSSATNFIDIDGTKFVNNSALYGGAMFVWGSNYSISNSVFDNNSAFGKGNMTPNNNNGGALVVTQGNIPISGTIINSNFTNNKAQYGGAAWINEGTVDISNSNFINNTATVEAGAIGFEPAYTKITATVYGTNFINNTAGVDGGAIYSNGDLRISDSDFDNNKAQKADIIYSNINGLLSINGNNYSNYTENKAPIINLAGIETISSDGGVIITVLDNKTVNVCYGDVVTLHAIITVDGVLVANQDLSFSVYNGEDVVVCKANSLLNGSYVATYKINDVINKTVSIVYDGPEVHINTGILNVSKANPDLTVGALNITVGDLEIITVTGPKDATGLITLTLNGIDYILPIYNGEAKFYFQDLAYGTYDVSASYSGDNHYVAAENSTVFKVDKVLANLNIHVEDITFGENGLVIITLPSDIDGSIVTVNVNGKVYPVTVENGFAKLPLRELNAGDYTISAVFAGNDKYLPGVSNALLTVSKADPALNVLISDVGYDGVFNINVALTGVDAIGLNGNVIVTVNNKDYSVNIVNGKGTAVGVKLAAGTYDFTAAWAGNDNYNAVGDSGKFSVAKVDSIIDVAVSDIKVGEDAVISVKLLSDATGSVTVTVNGKDYTETVVNGVANVKVADLKAGTYDVAVKYSGDNNYNAAVATSSFTVSKVDSTMDVTVNDIVFGGDLIVDAVLPGDATGEVVITVNGVDYHVSIENGKATGTISGLAAGDYPVTVKYVGDDKYTGVEVAENVNVAKAQPVLGVVIADVDYGNGFVIEATLTGVNSAPLSGNVIVTVAGKEYTVKVTGGKGIATGDKLAAGTYAFAAAWAGDDNYNIVTENGDFKVNKIDSSVAVNVNNIKVGEELTITVNVPSDATGDVTVSVDGKEYNVAIENGKAVKTIADLKANDYTVTVKYSGDNNYNAAVAASSFTVSKVDSTMDVTVNDIVFGGDLIVDAVLPDDATGEVVITVNGVDYPVPIVDGKATGTIGGLAAGDYTVTVKYAGDDKYTGVEITEGVNVAKAQPVLGVVIADVDYGNGFVIEATLTGVNSAPLSGNVIVTVAGKEYIVEVTDGKGIFTGDKLAAGTYGFAAAWAGNDNYNAVVENGDFKVNKIDSTVAVNADDIKVGENVTVTVNVPTDATGDVIIIVDGVDYTVAIENGKAVKTIADLKANDYTVTVKYSGDNNYNANQNTTEFTVSKISDYNMNITVPEFKEGVNSTINVVLPKDATGTVTVEIGGKNYTANVTDGVANVIIPGLGVGDYNITTTYSGDAKYDLMTKKGNITVIPNVDVNLDVDDVVMVYHDGTRLVAKLTDYQGKPIVNATIYFNINGVNYARTTDANGTASIALNLESGAYPVIVAYNGSASYSKISKNITVTINPSIIADDLVKMYKNDTKFSAKFLGSDGKVLANTTVKFNINGVLYTRTTNNDGVGSLAINLRPGEYVLTAYNPVTGEQQGFNITVKSLIVTQDLTKYYMNASSFQATIYDKNGSLAVGKNVTFNINGVFYTRTADENGVVSLAINLRPGEYIITTIYEGLDIGNNIVVLPTLVTHDINMTYMDGSKFTAQTLDGHGKPLANQNVSFNVNGVFYHKVTDDNGFASLTINLMSGKYIITSSWNDFQTGNNITIS